MTSYGVEPFLECSSRGVSRLSAMYARIKSRGNHLIDDLYECSKRFPNGDTGMTWREQQRDHHGGHWDNTIETRAFFSRLWDDYMAENPDLLDMVCAATGLQNTYGTKGHVCSAGEVWRIREQELARRAAEPPVNEATLATPAAEVTQQAAS